MRVGRGWQPPGSRMDVAAQAGKSPEAEPPKPRRARRMRSAAGRSGCGGCGCCCSQGSTGREAGAGRACGWSRGPVAHQGLTPRPLTQRTVRLASVPFLPLQKCNLSGLDRIHTRIKALSYQVYVWYRHRLCGRLCGCACVVRKYMCTSLLCKRHRERTKTG